MPVVAAKTMRFAIDSDLASCQQVQQAVMSEVERLGYCQEATFAIRLSLEEAIVNAVKHGNKFNPSKHVYVEAQVTPEQTNIAVEDEGTGFDRTCVPDPRCDENLAKCGGRGILLIEAYMSGVAWSNRGRRLTMWRRNCPDAVECSRHTAGDPL